MIPVITRPRTAQIALLWLVTIVITIFITIEFMPIAGSCKILYVAQDELMQLEQQRIKNEPLENRILFFGRVDEAIKLATILPKSYQGRHTKVLYAESKISGESVRSISKEVHWRIVQELSKGNDKAGLNLSDGK